MAYIDIERLKRYLDISTTTPNEDQVLQDAISEAQDYIEKWTERQFESQSPATYSRFFGYNDLNDYQDTIFLDEDLAVITEIKLGDGTVIAPTDYITVPRNDPPYNQIKLNILNGSVGSWRWTEGDIEITGEWVYSQTPPPLVQRAAVRLAAWLYRQRDTQDTQQDRPIVSPTGLVILPSAVGKDVHQFLDNFKKKW